MNFQSDPVPELLVIDQNLVGYTCEFFDNWRKDGSFKLFGVNHFDDISELIVRNIAVTILVNFSDDCHNWVDFVVCSHNLYELFNVNREKLNLFSVEFSFPIITVYILWLVGTLNIWNVKLFVKLLQQ